MIPGYVSFRNFCDIRIASWYTNKVVAVYEFSGFFLTKQSELLEILYKCEILYDKYTPPFIFTLLHCTKIWITMIYLKLLLFKKSNKYIRKNALSPGNSESRLKLKNGTLVLSFR